MDLLNGPVVFRSTSVKLYYEVEGIATPDEQLQLEEITPVPMPEPVPRKRGRPRKNLLPELVPRKRGRPRKNLLPETANTTSYDIEIPISNEHNQFD